MNLSIVIPAHNEADNIALLIKKIEDSIKLPHELVIVNDHSQDNTAQIVNTVSGQYGNIKLVENTLDKGFGNALKSGFQCASGEAVVPVMGDLCDDLSTIEKMYEKINQGYDVVSGSRYMKGGERLGGSKLKGFLSNIGGRSLHILLGIPTHDIANAFKMYRKKVISSMNIKSNNFAISMEIPLKAYFLGFKITEVPTGWRERTKGKSSFKVFKLLPSYLRLYAWAVAMRARKLLCG